MATNDTHLSPTIPLSFLSSSKSRKKLISRIPYREILPSATTLKLPHRSYIIASQQRNQCHRKEERILGAP